MPVRRPPPPEIRAILEGAAAKHGIPAELVISVAHAESRYDPRAVSPAGAMGLMQLMPRTAEGLGVSDPFDPRQSADAGAGFLSRLYARFGNWPKTLAAYNWGPGNVKRHPLPEQWPSSTRRYIARILDTPIDESAPPQPTPWAPAPSTPAAPAPSTPAPLLAVAALLGLALLASRARR